MARNISEIQTEIVVAITNDPVLAELNSRSATAIYRLVAYIVASFIWILESLFEAHQLEVRTLIENQKPHTLRWYVNQTKAFQYGVDLSEYGAYDNTHRTSEQIANQRIVAEAAAIENNGRVTIKAVKKIGDVFTPLAPLEYIALNGYLGEIKDAGVKVDLISREPDKLYLVIDIFYNNQVLSPTGARLDGSNETPVKTAILGFLQTIPFDGIFWKVKLASLLQGVDGVIAPEIRNCRATRSDIVLPQNVDVSYQPYSGCLKIYDAQDLRINYIAI